jgi:cytochrome c
MVQYILTLSAEKVAKTLPLTGYVRPGNETEGAYLLTATYFDKGKDNLPSIPASETVVLRNSTLTAEQATELNVARIVRFGGAAGLDNVRNNAWAAFKQIDLTGVVKATVSGFLNESTVGGEVEFHLDKPDGKLLGKAKLTAPGRASATTRLESVDGMHDLYVVFKNNQAGDKNLFYFGAVKLENK